MYGPWLEGVGSRNAASRFKGYRMFRNARQKLNRVEREVTNKWMGRLMEQLN